jgi:hypothetical protein
MTRAMKTMCTALGALAIHACCGDCPTRSGTFEFRFTETSGSCGDITTQVVTLSQDDMLDDCLGDVLVSEDNCTVTNVDVTCPSLTPGIVQVMNGKFEWDCDNTMIGTANIRLEDSAGVICQSSYDVEAEQL